MVNCCVPQCLYRKEKGCGVSFHHFPMDSVLVAKWLLAIFRHGGKPHPNWVPTKSTVVCGRHFKATDYSTSTTRRILLPHSVPSIFTKDSRNNSVLRKKRNVEEDGGNYNENLLETKKSKTREAWLESQNIEEDMGYDIANEMKEESSVKYDTEVLPEQIEYFSVDENTGEEPMKVEDYETGELQETTLSIPICRLCASESEDIIPIFEDERPNNILLEKIHTYLPIMITAEDLLPTTVCRECINKLEICHSLVQGCMDADAVLKTMFDLQHTNEEYNDDGNQFETQETFNDELEENTAYEDHDQHYVNNSDVNTEVLPEDVNEDQISDQFDDQSGMQDNYVNPNTHSINTEDFDTNASESADNKLVVNWKQKLKNLSWKGRIKPKFKVVIVKMKNLNNVTDKVELQKTVKLAINEKMKQKSSAPKQDKKLPEMSSINNHCAASGAEISKFEDNEQDSRQNKIEIASDHTYTLKVCCQYCEEKFVNKEQLLLHQQTSEECGDGFQCKNCNSLHKSKQALDQHSQVCYSTMNQPEDKENLNHTNCKDTENHSEIVLEQATNEIKDISSNDYKVDAMKKHIEVEVLDIDIKTDKKPGTFRLDRGCHIKFPKGFEHINTTHQAKILTAINKIIEKKLPKPDVLVNDKIKGPNGWKCRLCYQTFSTSRAYRIHRQTHTPRPFPCTHCNRMFTSERNLKQHLIIHSKERKHMCEYCGKIFKLKDSLKLHYFSHGKSEKIHKCNQCGKSFGSKYRYNQHLLRHGKATYLCDICGKSMKYPGSLRCHKLLHKRKILYECGTCGKIYYSRQGLKTHTQIHLGEAPFGCDKCGKHFETYLNLSEHKLIHVSSILYKCHVCGKCFNLRPQLKRHIARHQLTLKYTCKQCNIIFGSMKELLIHRRSHAPLILANYQVENQLLSEIT